MRADHRGPLPRLAAALAAAALPLAGCDALIGVPEPDETADACAWTEAQAGADPSDVAAELVVLIDLSASMWETDSGEVRDFGQDVADAVAAVFDLSGERLVSVGTFDGDASSVTPHIDAAPLPEVLAQGDEQQLEQIRGCVRGTVQEAIAAPPRAPGTDVLAAISAGAESFTGEGERQLMIVTDGQSNTGCMDLNRVLGAEADHSAIAADCQERGEWPDASLAGVDLRLVGISGEGVEHTGELSGTQGTERIAAFWDAVGAELTGTGSGDFTEASDQLWVPAPEVEREQDAPVLLAGYDDEGITVTVSADALFDTDSAELLPEAVESIDAVVAANDGLLDRRGTVEVTGHTDSRGDDGYNEGLSQRRAEAVRRHLAAEGFTRVRAEGRGDSAPVCDDMSAGAFDEECGRLNRRVEIEFNQA
ncbi:OmpA family protein [Allonocardiopsis opalescens]|uniref:Outer membrane protein OmpA-like peptidoglycan-associated protein n=1 Tax=Allonocardiopsis opalescens TaxID=1144618 RepID=A0A2T0QA75_9ACTN|nr:OmpA family protein [Allonocardiopsis opalescens]PRY00712.1 outer membrane protein OmpA-like peptidoglycan-associated protein [Allonocardiopsis opalescens]